MELSPQELTIVGTLGGALVGALPGIISSLLNRRTEERKQFRELVVKAAIESWKTHVEIARNSPIFPLEHYIIHTAKMCEIALSDKKLTPESMKQHLQDLTSVMMVLAEHAKQPDAKQKQA